MIFYVVGNSLRLVYASKKGTSMFHEIKTMYLEISTDSLMTCRCNQPFEDRGVLFTGNSEENNIRIIQF